MKSSNNKNKINNNKKKINIKSSNQVNLFSNKNSSKNFSEKDFSNSSSFSEEISKSSFLSPSEEKEFKKMEISKNKDKLKKNHGCQDLITNLNEIKNLVDHTNRIFLYKTKMNSTSKKPKKFATIIEDRFLNNELNYDEENKISEKDKIISKIDKLISQIDVSK